MKAKRVTHPILAWTLSGLLAFGGLAMPATAFAEEGNQTLSLEVTEEAAVPDAPQGDELYAQEEAPVSQDEETLSQQGVVLVIASDGDEGDVTEDPQKVGWIAEDGVIRYYDASGTMAKGWRTIDGYRYYFQANGAAKTGWLTLGSNRYFFDADGAMQTGWLTRGKKTYYFNSAGVMQKGWKTIEGKKYHFSSKGVMDKGLKKIKGKRYCFTSEGVMANCGLYKNYIIAWNGVLRKIPAKKTGNKDADARRVAKLIAKCVPPKSKIKKQKDLTRVSWAAQYVSAFSSRCKYTMEGSDYYTAYGVFIAKKYTCAGSTAALGMVLECMGFKWTHVNKSMMKHQWVKLKMDGKKGYADGQVGWAGYGKHPVESQL